MEKYSREWKLKQGAWIQDHKNSSGEKIYKIHYIENDTEYSKGEYFTKKEASEALRASQAAAALGRIGGSAKTEAKTASSRENGKKGGRPVEKKTYWILSGEGEEGTWTKHFCTLTGIKRIATKERCNGDRFARIWEEIPETDTTEAHIYDIDNGDMRDVPEEE